MTLSIKACKKSAQISKNLKIFLRDFLQDRSGTTAIEYAIIASGVALVIITSVFSLGVNVKGWYTSVANLF